MNSQDFRSLQEAYSQVYELDEISDRKVAAVGKRREKDVSKAFDNYADVSEKPGGTQKLATDISKLNRFKNLEKKRDRRINKESYDLFDYIMEYLITEGYADTNENALVIMANMSEDWRESIIEEQTDPLKTASENAAKRNTAYGSKKFQDGLKLSPSNPNSPNFDPKTLKTPGV